MAKKEKVKPQLIVNYTEGWEERFVKAAYKFYLKIEKRKELERREQLHTNN